MIWEKLEILGLETTRFGVFVQLSLIWWNWLARLIDWLDHYFMLPILCNDQFGQLVGFLKVGFQNLGFLDIISILKPILWFQSNIELILTALEHASCVDIVHVSYKIVISIFFYANLQSALGFSVSFSLCLFCVCPFDP